MKKLLTPRILALFIIAASAYFVATLYLHRSKDPRQQILGKWYFLADEASEVTFLPQGKLTMHNGRREYDMTSKYEFMDDNHIRFRPGAFLLSGEEVYSIRFVDKNTMYLQSKMYGDRKYSRYFDDLHLDDLADLPKESKAAKFWRTITGAGK